MGNLTPIGLDYGFGGIKLVTPTTRKYIFRAGGELRTNLMVDYSEFSDSNKLKSATTVAVDGITYVFHPNASSITDVPMSNSFENSFFSAFGYASFCNALGHIQDKPGKNGYGVVLALPASVVGDSEMKNRVVDKTIGVHNFLFNGKEKSIFVSKAGTVSQAKAVATQEPDIKPGDQVVYYSVGFNTIERAVVLTYLENGQPRYRVDDKWTKSFHGVGVSRLIELQGYQVDTSAADYMMSNDQLPYSTGQWTSLAIAEIAKGQLPQVRKAVVVGGGALKLDDTFFRAVGAKRPAQEFALFSVAQGAQALAQAVYG